MKLLCIKTTWSRVLASRSFPPDMKKLAQRKPRMQQATPLWDTRSNKAPSLTCLLLQFHGSLLTHGLKNGDIFRGISIYCKGNRDIDFNLQTSISFSGAVSRSSLALFSNSSSGAFTSALVELSSSNKTRKPSSETSCYR
jgi:hypothetical protein